jgi:hypothetical protein
MRIDLDTRPERLEIIDADNLEIIREGEPRLLINFPMLRNLMSGSPGTKRIYYRPEVDFTVSVRQRVQAAGYEVETTYKNSDGWFLVDGVWLGQHCKTVAFVGGDHCLLRTLELFKTLGIHTDVWSWRGKTNRRVKALADRYVPLDPLGIVLGRDIEGWNRRQRRLHAKRFRKASASQKIGAACS